MRCGAVRPAYALAAPAPRAPPPGEVRDGAPNLRVNQRGLVHSRTTSLWTNEDCGH